MMGSARERVAIVTRTPDVPGHTARTVLRSAVRTARTADDRFWLVRTHRWSRWRWLPQHGVITSLIEVHDG